ncbi:MAG: prolyl oligopeptidase family serine peptidase [Aequorivita antarctica]
MENNNCNPLKLFWISTTQVIFSMLVLMACPIWGQAVKKKDLTPEDYKLWYNITPPKLNNDGSWFSFHKYYKSGEDTLVIQNIQDSQQIVVGNGRQEQFLENSDRFLYIVNNNLILKNLKTGIDSAYQNAVDYKVSPQEKYLVVLSESIGEGNSKTKNLTVTTPGNSALAYITNIMEYNFDNAGEYLAFSQKTENGYQLGYLNLEKKDTPKTILMSSVNPFTKIVWGTAGHLACFEELDKGYNNIVHWFNVKSKKNDHGSFNSMEQVQLSDPSRVVNNISTTLHFSPDNGKLFFHIQKTPKIVPQEDHGSKVQVWNTKDVVIYPTYGEDKSFTNNPPIMVAWNLGNNKIHYMGDRQCAKSMWGNEARFVYSYSFFEDQSMGRNKTPIKVFNSNTGEEKFVMDQPFKTSWSVSPTGKYLCYFKDADWWVYDAETNSHRNLTKDVGGSFINKKDLKAGQINPYGLAGWTQNDREVLLYDEYDIWVISTEGKFVKKLTEGKKEQLVFRISKAEAGKNNLFGYAAHDINLKEGLLLNISEKNTAQTGLYELLPNSPLKKLVLEDSNITNIVKSSANNTILYTVESFGHPPAIYCYILDASRSVKVFQSNPQHFEYNWGEKEMVEYKTEDGKTLRGALFYPSNFDPGKKYPMITDIYEKRSYIFNQYVNPSLFNGVIINISNYTADGYFVFCPDIEYTVNEPMVSALNCVTAAVKEVSKKPFIDKNKIGLFGHSFGGFEASYIAGRSNLFATVVSASGVHNLRSFQLSNAWNWKRPQVGRFFNDQFRFNAPYFEIPQKYEENSPLNFAESLNTPFLTVTGDQDSNINWEQSIEMYNALRILNKEHIMLIYPEEGHDLSSREAQLDATQKYGEWFGYYLKNEKRPQWMEAFN